MRKRITSMAAILLFVLSVTVQAVSPRYTDGNPDLSFSGTTAYCSVVFASSNSGDRLTATLTLSQGTRRLATWDVSGVGEVSISESYQVERGKTYTLTFNSTVNGKGQREIVVTGTC